MERTRHETSQPSPPTPPQARVCPVQWHRIDTVLLDMDGTLLDLHYDNYFWSEFLPCKISERDGIPLWSVKAAIAPVLQNISGTLPFYCIDHWSRVFSCDILAWKRQLSGKIAVRAGAREFLSHLQQRGMRVIMATNAHRATVNLKLDKTQLQHFFHVISSSHDYGIEKERGDYWIALAGDHRIDLTRSLLVDDNPQVLDAARASGVAQLLGVRIPDSRQPPVTHHRYPMTEDFQELLTVGRG